MRWRIDLYVFREILGPLALGFVLYTFILLLQALFKLAQLIITNGVPFETVAQMLWLSLPRIVVLTIPMALLFGILIAVGRLSADSELVALRASGISLFSLSPRRTSLYRPVLVLSAILAGLNLYLMLEVMPAGNTALERMRLDILSQGINEHVAPRTFFPAWQGKLLFVFDQPVDDPRWKGVFMANAIPSGKDDVWVAEWGEAQYRDDAAEVGLRLTDAYEHRVDLEDPGRYEILYNNTFERVVDLPAEDDSGVASGRALRSQRIEELAEIEADPTLEDVLRRRARVERHKRFAIPAACLVFGLLALPFGITRSRGGKSSGFAVSIFIILVYYVLLNWSEELAVSGSVPPVLAVWSANLLMLIAGLYFLVQKNRDKNLLLQRFDQWIQTHLWRTILNARSRREARREARMQGVVGRRARASVVLQLQPIAFRVLGRIDRYVLVSFLRVLVLALLGGLSVYMIADLTDKIDDIASNQVPADVVLTYYKYRSFAILYQIAPIIMLIATLITFALLSRSNEITAIKALGISLYRLTLPVVVAATLLAGLAGVLQSEVLPAASLRVAELEARIKNQDPVRSASVRRADRQWLATPDNVLYNYRAFRPEREQVLKLQVFRFDDDFRLTHRMVVERATWAGNGWWLVEDGWVRTIVGRNSTYLRIDQPRRINLSLTPGMITGENEIEPLPDGMTYTELRDHVAELRLLGRPSPTLEVSLHNKIAYPAMSLVMALVALPFSFRLGRKGALYGVGMSLILGIAFFVVLAAFTALGEAGILPALMAVWSPGAIFSIFSLYLFLGVET